MTVKCCTCVAVVLGEVVDVVLSEEAPAVEEEVEAPISEGFLETPGITVVPATVLPQEVVARITLEVPVGELDAFTWVVAVVTLVVVLVLAVAAARILVLLVILDVAKATLLPVNR